MGWILWDAEPGQRADVCYRWSLNAWPDFSHFLSTSVLRSTHMEVGGSFGALSFHKEIERACDLFFCKKRHTESQNNKLQFYSFTFKYYF